MSSDLPPPPAPPPPPDEATLPQEPVPPPVPPIDAPLPPGMPPVGVPTGGPPLSSAGKRFGGWLLDGLLFLVTFGIGWIIWSLVIWSKGQSPAKSLLGMRVVRTDTRRAATWGTMFIRDFLIKGLLVSICYLIQIVSAFMILGADRQGIWDKMVNTVVVDDPDGLLLN